MEAAYSVILRNRPERTAFIFDVGDATRAPERFQAIFDEIISVCHRRWAGRNSPMAFFAGDAFTEEEWANLELADADRIISFSALPATLAVEIDRRLNPEELRVIESFEKIEPRIDIGMNGHGIEVSAVQALLKQFPADYFLSFQISHPCPPEVRQFCAVNFGRDDVWSPTVFPTATPYEFSALQDVQMLTYGMDNVGHLVEFLTSLVRERKKLMRVTAACQLGSVLEPHIPVPLGGLDKAFQIIIGDSPADLVEHWDGGRWKHNTYRPYARQLWIPSALARQEAVMKAAIQYAWVCNSDSWLGEPRQRIELISWSWKEADLMGLIPTRPSDTVGGEIDVVPSSELNARRAKHVAERLAFPRSLLQHDNDTIRLSGTRATDHWELPAPDILRMVRTHSGSGGSWAVDVLVEQPHVEDSGAGGERWWLLPRKSCGKLPRRIFERPARINRHGFFSLSFCYDSTREKRLTLQVKRPDPQWMFSYLFWPRQAHEWGSPYDARATLTNDRPSIRYLGSSDKGDYLSALISLFGDLDGAREFTGRKFWRETFERLANRERKKDSVLTADIARVITKMLPSEKPREDLVVSTAERIVGFVGQRVAPKSISRRELEERYAAYAEEAGGAIEPQEPAKSAWEQRARPLSHEGMKRQLSWLVNRDVIQIGVELQCVRCGVRSWVHIDRAKQHLACSGCGHEQSLSGEPEWHYELNSLALRCVTSNQLAALQALCQLASRASHSFAYSTSLEIFRDNEQKPWHEIDLICLCDGRLIVAEVKDTTIVEGDLRELAEIAEALQADDALLFTPAKLLSAKHQKWKSDLRTRMERSNIRFDYVGLEQV